MPSLLEFLLSWFSNASSYWCLDIFCSSNTKGGKIGAMGFNRSKAKLLNRPQEKVTFNDVVDRGKS